MRVSSDSCTNAARRVHVVELRVGYEDLLVVDRQPECFGHALPFGIGRTRARRLARPLRGGSHPALQLRVEAHARDAATRCLDARLCRTCRAVDRDVMAQLGRSHGTGKCPLVGSPSLTPERRRPGGPGWCGHDDCERPALWATR